MGEFLGLIFFDPSATKGDSGKKHLMLTDVEVGGETVLAGEKRNGQMILAVSPEKQEKLVFASDNNDFHLFFPICVTDWHSARLLTVCFLRTKNGK